MKSFKQFSLALVLVSVFTSSHAATFTITPNPITTSASFSNGPVNGIGSDTYNFTVVPNSGGSSSITNIGFKLMNGYMADFQAVIDGTINLVLNTTTINNGAILNLLSTTFGELSSGAHTLTVSWTGAVNASYGGNLNINPVGAVPVPAAIWLFGSALAGLIGFDKRSKKMNKL